MSFTVKINEVTGAPEMHLQVELVSIAATSKKNSNGTEYFPVGLKFVKNGKEYSTPGQIFKGNIDRAIADGNPVTVGQTYNAHCNKGDKGQYLFTMSHLQGGGLLEEEVFADEFAAFKTSTADTTATATA
jgi:hypothetical protein